MNLSRRNFLKTGINLFLFSLIGNRTLASSEESDILQKIDFFKPSRLSKLPANFNSIVGATHVAGKYYFTKKPFLIEGAERLISLKTRLGKFWLIPKTIRNSYPFNSEWGDYNSLTDCIKSNYFRQVLEMPFNTFIFEAHSPVEEPWRSSKVSDNFYKDVGKEFYELTKYLYQNYRKREVVFILQHWEGDWMLRGRAGELWKEPPANWKELCERMIKWLSARQEGVKTAREEFGKGASCVVAHAAEVNRVVDAWQNIPTVTRNVLPYVQLDLVSYSAYDGMKDPLTMWKCINEIKANARTGTLFGKRAVYIGEIGIPENEQRQNLRERWDALMGVFLATDMKFIVQWELFCNEIKPDARNVSIPIKDENHMRGFWLVKPDNNLSITGEFFHSLWLHSNT